MEKSQRALANLNAMAEENIPYYKKKHHIKFEKWISRHIQAQHMKHNKNDCDNRPVNRDECKSHPQQKISWTHVMQKKHWFGITPPNRKSQTRNDSDKAARDQLNLDWQIVTRIDAANIEVTCGMGHTWSLETRVLSKQCPHQQTMQAGLSNWNNICSKKWQDRRTARQMSSSTIM